MNFSDSPQEAAFRAEARAWLQAHVPRHLDADLRRSSWARLVLQEHDLVQESKQWQAKKAEAGWACLHWPREHGGRGATPVERLIWEQEEGVYNQLSFLFVIGFGMCGPTLMAHASETQQRRHLPAIASGREVWCQLFSEPGAGSDLAGIRTRAVRDGDDWVVQGQKIWTTSAQHADWGILITRTDPSVPKHQGLTMFFVDMRSHGVRVVPLRQANDDFEFNEVFFDQVRIPDAQRLGAVGDGWRVALTTLMNERLSVGSAMPTGFPELLAYCRTPDAQGRAPIDDAAVRARLAVWAVRESGLKYTTYRRISAMSRGHTPGPENAMTKLVAGSTMQEIAAYALELQGSAGVLTETADAPVEGLFQGVLLRAPATRVEGGTDQVLRNIIGERVLGLPPEPRVDKDLPFNRLPAS